jgi:hypothetical protein
MPYSKDHDRFARLFKPRSGETLATATIKEIVQRDSPEMQSGSIIPSDHDDFPNKGECDCRRDKRHLFERVGYGLYKVL